MSAPAATTEPQVQSPDDGRASLNRGLLFGASTYGIWGLLPLYWRLLDGAGAVEVLAHRFVWTLGFIALLLLFRPRSDCWRALRERPAKLWILGGAAVVIAFNWYLYIWGVNHERVVETSLGYFMSPLITVVIGVVLFRERLRRPQWLALGLAVVAVAWLTFDYGRVPWVAVGLALSFATYGLLKKKAATGALEGLAVEATFILPAVLGYLVWLEIAGRATFGHDGWSTTMLLIAAGPATAVPLLFFAGAVRRIPLTYLGLLQYLTPTVQFVLGVFVFGEQMPPERLAGFALIWAALAIFTGENLRHLRKLRRETLSAQPSGTR
ncbi:chloramphenicol-sensitive protein RarD [Kribbella steppae]|uniref:Chloramphenicol-sensitive protein RarD n=1 Tax=Kribbella steppae TaxID=2512223 RepID=A0A4R2HHE8_9ACTN|nr:EamA family transporter RarD [Kribbella steppae]TCO28552.1 chloramphenicol-sensitive protein RarD [Kribbella steppae]